MRGVPIILKTRRLLHIHVLRKETMKECIVDLNLSKTPALGHIKRENQTNHSWFHDRAESVTIINAVLLSESTGNKTCLVLINGTIWSLLGLKNALAANNINTRGRGTSVQVCVFCRAVNSSVIAARHAES